MSMKQPIQCALLLLASLMGSGAHASDLSEREGELINPDASTMVLLYYDLAGVPIPFDKMVEADMRVRTAVPMDKAARREEVRAELQAAAKAVEGIGVLRLSLADADLSEYDPTYGEFLVRALAPSSALTFKALGQEVSLKFGNGKTAQIWRVTKEEAQAVRDKTNLGTVGIDVTVKIAKVQPGPGGGTIVADVTEYDLQNAYHGLTIGRIKIGK